MLTTRLTTPRAWGFCDHQLALIQRPFYQRVSLSSLTTAGAKHKGVSRASLGSPVLAPRLLLLETHHCPILSCSRGLARHVWTRPGAAAETYVAYGMTQKLFESCSSQADYTIPQASEKGVAVPLTESGEHLGVGHSWWYQELGLLPTFSTWSQITFLHMYLLTVRLRALPTRDSVQTYSRHLIDHFSHNAEHRMDVLHDIGSRTIRNKYLKDLFIQWRGIIAAYDEGLVKGDAVLGAAVWRNLWKASYTGPGGKDVDWTKIAWVVAYMRRVLSELSKMQEADMVFALGHGAAEGSGVFAYSPIDKRMAGLSNSASNSSS